LSGTVAGGKKASATNKMKYGENFHVLIGRKGGLAGNPATKGFASNRELARKAGSMGGKASGRGRAKKKPSVLIEEQTAERSKEINTGGFWDKFRRFQNPSS